MNQEISNEQLNAFVDGELDLPEKDGVFAMLEADAELAQEVCELRTIKELMRHGYAEPPALPRKDWARKFDVPQSLVAGVMLVLGLSLGWMGHDWNRPGQVMQLAQAQPKTYIRSGELLPVSLAGVTEDMHKIVMHVDTSDPAKIATLLDDVQFLAQHKAVHGQPVQVEVIASHNGLSMLRTDVTPYAGRVKTLVDNYPNVVFVACNQTIQRLNKEGVKVKLLPHTRVAPTATEEIVNRLHGGWTYIKV